MINAVQVSTIFHIADPAIVTRLELGTINALKMDPVNAIWMGLVNARLVTRYTLGQQCALCQRTKKVIMLVD